MGIIKQGILGGFSGKVGAVVGTSWKGRAVMKALPLSVANPRTSGQVNQRNAFKSCVEFASTILASMIIPLMNRFAGNISGYNLFVSRNVVNFDETGLIEPQDLNFGTGKLGETPITSAIADASADTIEINWSNVLDNSFKLDTDESYLMVTNEDTGEILLAGALGTDRISGTTSIGAITGFNAGNGIGLYLVFLRSDGTQVGNTAYLRVIAVA